MCPLDDSLLMNNPSNLMSTCDGTGTYPYAYEDFMPVSTTVIKTLKMKFVIIQNTAKDFDGNFESSTETTKFFNDALADMNFRYSYLQTDITCDLPDPNDTKIQFSFELDFLTDPSGTGSYWDNPTSGGINTWCPGYVNYDLDPLLSDEMEYINVFFTEDDCYFEYIVNATPCATGPAIVSCSLFPKFIDMDYVSQVNMRGVFTSYYDKKYNGGTWPGTYWDATETTYHSDNRYWWAVEALGKTLTHELGHSIDLYHVAPTVPCYSTRIMNNTGAATKTYLDEDEVGQANRSLYLSSVKKYVADCPIDNTNNLIITGDETWEYDITLYSDLIINSGATLTIKCKVSMPTDSKIIVQRGASLILDGGTITSSCGDFWQGIEVWGQGSSTPHPSIASIYDGSYPSSSTHHGVVYLKEGSVIELARNGITTSKYDDFSNPLYWGGIVVADGASFINCRRAVEFMKFDYYTVLPNLDDDNISEFWRSNFEVNEDFPCGESFYAHVSMWDVDGVIFVGNAFSDLRDVCTNNAMGIYSIDATYTVASYFCGGATPCDEYVGSFEGFFKAIVAENANYRPRDIVIGDILFTDNYRGILLSFIANSTLINNTFEIQDIPTTSFNAYGIYLEDCVGYHVENNSFTTYGTFDDASPFNGGIYVVNNSDAVTEIYRNYFENLEAGIRVQTENSKLQIKCNTFTSPLERHDIYVTNTGLLAHQGQCLGGVGTSDLEKALAMANNVFTHDCNNVEGDIKIFSGHPELKYRHHPSAPMTPSCYSTGTTYVTPVTCANTTSDGCPSELPSGGTGYKLDGSNTPQTGHQLLIQIQSLTVAIEGLQELLDDQNAENEVIENNDLVYLQDEKDKLLREAVNLYYLEGKIDSAILVIENEDIVWKSRKIAELHIISGNYSEAKTIVDEIPSDGQENSDFKTLAGVLITMGEDERSIDSLTETEISTLLVIAGKQSNSGVAAENILSFITGVDYPEIIDPDDKEVKENRQIQVVESTITINPNPANNELIVDVHSLVENSEYAIIIYNISGTKLYSSQIAGNAINYLDISNLPSGILIVKILESNLQIRVEKIIHN